MEHSPPRIQRQQIHTSIPHLLVPDDCLRVPVVLQDDGQLVRRNDGRRVHQSSVDIGGRWDRAVWRIEVLHDPSNDGVGWRRRQLKGERILWLSESNIKLTVGLVLQVEVNEFRSDEG